MIATNKEKEIKKEYLSQIILKENPTFSDNNLILAPVGSGKSTLIDNVLAKDIKEKMILLLPKKDMKNFIHSKKGLDSKYIYYDKDVSFNADEILNDGEILVMSYSDFGLRTLFHNDFIKGITKIFCDNSHYLFEYRLSNFSVEISVAFKILINECKGIQIFHFTSNYEHLITFEEKYIGGLEDIKVFNYLNYPNLKRYDVISEYKIKELKEIKSHIKSNKKSNLNHKYLAMNRTIKGQKELEAIAIEAGLNPLTLWSLHNDDKELEMAREQIEARKHILIHKEIPEPYNFLIVNDTMLDNLPLLKSSFNVVIVNVDNETDKTQIISKLKRNIEILICRIFVENNTDIIISLSAEYLNTQLTTKMRENLCNELKIINKSGKIAQWAVIKRLLLAQKYTMEEGYLKINDKRLRTYTIYN